MSRSIYYVHSQIEAPSSLTQIKCPISVPVTCLVNTPNLNPNFTPNKITRLRYRLAILKYKKGKFQSIEMMTKYLKWL